MWHTCEIINQEYPDTCDELHNENLMPHLMQDTCIPPTKLIATFIYMKLSTVSLHKTYRLVSHDMLLIGTKRQRSATLAKPSGNDTT